MNKEKLINMLDKILEWALYILVFTIPFSKTMIEICIAVAFVAWIFKKILTKDFRLGKTPLNALLFAFLAINLISFVNADFKLLFTRAIITKCLKFLALYFIVIETVDSKVKFKNLLIMAFISANIVMLDAFIQYYVVHYDLFGFHASYKYAPKFDPTLGRGCPTGPFTFPNDLAAWMLIVIFPVLSLFMRNKEGKAQKAILGVFLAPFLFLLYLTNARSAWLGFSIPLFLIFLMHNRKMFITVVAIFILIAILIAIFLPKKEIEDITCSLSFKDRLYMWRIGWNIFMEHPIIGSGLNSFFLKFKELREDSYKNERGSYAHNGFLQMLAETGIIGLAVFFFIIGKAIAIGIRAGRGSSNADEDAFYRAFTRGLTGGLVAFLIQAFFDTNLQSLPLVVLFWFGLALLINAKSIYEKRI